jgi:nitrous oxidase accessory protein NosD
MKTLAALSAAAVLAAAAPALAETRKVPSDDYPTIQSAVDAAQDGDVVLVAKGTYAEDVVVNAKSNLTIRGAGSPVITPASRGFDATNCSVLSITGFLVQGADEGVAVAGSTGVLLSKIRVESPANLGIQVAGCPGARVSRCTVTGSGGQGILDIASPGLVIEKCSVTGFALDAIALSVGAGAGPASNDAVVAKNRISGGSTAVRFGGTGIRIEKNRLTGIGAPGISTDGVTNCAGTVISKNRVEVAGGVAVQAQNNSIRVEKNTCVGGGILSQGSGSVFDRNSVLAAAGDGLRSTGSGIQVLGNRIRGASGRGIDLDGGLQTVERNSVAETDSDGIRLQAGTGGSVLDRNRVAGSDTYGILVLATPVTVTGNRSSKNGLADYADSGSEGDNFLDRNRFGTLLFDFVP